MNSCLKKDRPSQEYSIECTGKCGSKQSGGAQNTPVPVKVARDDRKRKTCTPFTVARRYATVPRLVEQPPENVPLARHTQRAGFTWQVKCKAGRAAGPKTAPSLLPTDESYAGTGHHMGTALTNEGHSSGLVESSEFAHGTAGSGRTDTDWSDNGTSGGTSILEAGGDTKFTTLALATNHSPYSDSTPDWGGGGATAHSEGADDTDTVNKHSHTAAGSAENGAPHDTGHEGNAMPKEVDTGIGSALATAKGHETANGDMGVAQHMAQDIGSAQTYEDGDETNKVNSDGHPMGSENDHTTEHKAADTDSAESKCKDHDAPHENGAESRGRAIGVEE